MFDVRRMIYSMYTANLAVGLTLSNNLEAIVVSKARLCLLLRLRMWLTRCRNPPRLEVVVVDLG